MSSLMPAGLFVQPRLSMANDIRQAEARRCHSQHLRVAEEACPSWEWVLTSTLPEMRGKPVVRSLARCLTALGCTRLIEVRGWENIGTVRDPFILVLNHSEWFEAIFVPALCALARGGRRIAFLADWTFQLIPGLALAMRCGPTIPVMRRPARPAILNLLKPLFDPGRPALDLAAEALREGRSVGIFPEGTVNSNPDQLLRGDRGAALLALRTGKPVVPAGIQFPRHPGEQRPAFWGPMAVHFDTPIHPPDVGGAPSLGQVRRFHADIMQRLSRLSQKRWPFEPQEESHVPCPKNLGHTR